MALFCGFSGVRASRSIDKIAISDMLKTRGLGLGACRDKQTYKTQEGFIPLTSHSFERAVYVMKGVAL